MIKFLKQNPAASLFLIVFFIYANVAFHAGALCGDETCAVSLAQMPFREIIRWIGFDSYPILWPVVIKIFCGVFGYSDAAIRCLGLLIQFGILAALVAWWRVSGFFPFVTVAAFCLLPATINYTSCARAWGLGIATLILFWIRFRLWERGNTRSLFWLIASGILAAHSTYYNSVIIFSVLVAWEIRCRDWRAMGACLAIGVTMLPYLPIFISAGSHYKNLHVSYGFTDFASKLLQTAMAAGDGPFWFVWALLAVALVVAIHKKGFGFHAWSIVIAVPCYFIFLASLHYTTNPWYYLPLLCLVCLCADVLAKHWKWLCPVAVTLFLLEVPIAFHASRDRQTNIEDVISVVKKESVSGDLIVFSPWHTGEMFRHYYHGPASMLAIPHIPIHMMFVTRWDLESPFITDAEPSIDYAAARIQETVASGHRVFFVSTTDWSGLHALAPSLSQLRLAVPNQCESFYHSVVLNEKMVNFIQSCPQRVTVPSLKRDHVSPLSFYTLAILR